MRESYKLKLKSEGANLCLERLKMGKVQLTFFHDVLCPFCYVTSKRLKRVVSEFNSSVLVVHKAFAIISSLEDLKAVAPTEEDAREFFLKEFDILKKYFPDYDPQRVISKGNIGFTWSIPPLTACKVAEKRRGQEGHWSMFDRLQDAFFLEGQNVADEGVIIRIATQLGFEPSDFLREMRSKEAKYAVVADEDEARALGIRGVPAILINETWLIRGVPEESVLRDAISDILEHGEPRKSKLKAFWEYSTNY
jgi:predicted DsbA family dithiol-disulfide isomerase